MIVLDTNVVSELMAPAPSEVVMQWVGSRPTTSLYITSITQAEILFGIRLLPKGKRRDALDTVAMTIFDKLFGGRTIPFGSDAAVAYARLAADRRRRGLPIAVLDAQIASIVRAAGGTLATRNITDFKGCGIDLVNPWTNAE